MDMLTAFPIPAVSKTRAETTFRFLAEPTSVNFGGKVHGGALMKWIAETAYACAAMWSGRYAVTVSVGNIRFRRPRFWLAISSNCVRAWWRRAAEFD